METNDAAEAQRVIDAKNDALRQPALNLNIARAYFNGVDPQFSTRTWKNTLQSLIETKQGPTLPTLIARCSEQTRYPRELTACGRLGFSG